jgi:hypothetical protein
MRDTAYQGIAINWSIEWQANCFNTGMRVLLPTAISGVVLVTGFAFVPQLLKPAFAKDLTRPGCSIVRGNNVISDDFAGHGTRDWACQ